MTSLYLAPDLISRDNRDSHMMYRSLRGGVLVRPPAHNIKGYTASRIAMLAHSSMKPKKSMLGRYKKTNTPLKQKK